MKSRCYGSRALGVKVVGWSHARVRCQCLPATVNPEGPPGQRSVRVLPPECPLCGHVRCMLCRPTLVHFLLLHYASVQPEHVLPAVLKS